MDLTILLRTKPSFATLAMAPFSSGVIAVSTPTQAACRRTFGDTMPISRRTSITLLAIGLLAAPALPVVAAEADHQISYTSRPDRLAIFLNDIAYARDEVSLPGGDDARVILPDTVVPDTLILRENGARVPAYRLERRTGPLTVQWQCPTDEPLREVSIEYLLGGVSWRPTYDMWLGADSDPTVDLDFLAEIRDSSLTLDEVETRLVAGFVDIVGIPPGPTELNARSEFASYDAVGAIATGEATIQHIYDIGTVTAEPGDTAYLRMLGDTFPARRQHVWDARIDDNVDVIYKVLNESELPFAEGLVRSYQADMFVGSDAIETTPVGSEGSVTVGHLQDVRVERKETRTAIELGRLDYFHEVELSVSNFGPATLHLEVIDHRRPEAELLSFAQMPQQEAGNVLRWQMAVEPGTTETITYDFKVD